MATRKGSGTLRVLFFLRPAGRKRRPTNSATPLASALLQQAETKKILFLLLLKNGGRKKKMKNAKKFFVSGVRFGTPKHFSKISSLYGTQTFVFFRTSRPLALPPERLWLFVCPLTSREAPRTGWLTSSPMPARCSLGFAR